MNINIEKIFKVTCRIPIIERSMSYLFTSSALVLRPLPGSPVHLNQNLSSTFFNSDGFLPQSDAPGISLSSRNDPLDIFDSKLERVVSSWLIPWPYLPRSDAICYHSARGIRHYESRVLENKCFGFISRRNPHRGRPRIGKCV